MQMHPEDGLTRALFWKRDLDVTVKPSCLQDRSIDHLGMIAGSDDDNTLPAVDAVELL